MNIYQLQQELLSIYDELENNGGELTPELEEALTVTQDSFKDKIKNYTDLIKTINNDIDAIKSEQKRLKTLADTKNKVIDRLTTVIISAIETFGDVKKSGVKYLDYGTGQVSIRNSQAVSINEEVSDIITDSINYTLDTLKSNNQLDVVDSITYEDLDAAYSELATFKGSAFTEISEGDVENSEITLSINIPVKDILSPKGYDILKSAVKNSDNFKLISHPNKTKLKEVLKQNGACAPHLASLNINQSIIIK